MEFTNTLIEEIKKNYMLPCYVFDEVEFIKNYNNLRKAMRNEYSSFEIALSYKTNYAPKLCSIVKKLGGYAEVVSDMEYEIAKKIGYENSKIIYNGPFKGPRLEEHLINGGIVNIDNLDEIYRIIDFAKCVGTEFKVGLRVNIDVGQKFISRFGIDSSSNDMEEAVKLINASGVLKLVGLHCHIGQARSLQAWEKRTLEILKLADQYIDGVPDYLDLGSGMFGDVEEAIKNQFVYDIPSYEEYAKVTGRIINKHYAADNKKPFLFTEPGTTLDNRYFSIVSEVSSIKKIKGKYFAILNSSIHNLGDVSGSIRLPLQVINNNSNDFYDDIDFVGYTCLERDVLYKNYCGYISKGDYVIFGNVGGYSNVDKPPFILPQCAMIGINDSGTYLIKRKETTEDILETYIME